MSSDREDAPCASPSVSIFLKLLPVSKRFSSFFFSLGNSIFAFVPRRIRNSAREKPLNSQLYRRTVHYRHETFEKTQCHRRSRSSASFRGSFVPPPRSVENHDEFTSSTCGSVARKPNRLAYRVCVPPRDRISCSRVYVRASLKILAFGDSVSPKRGELHFAARYQMSAACTGPPTHRREKAGVKVGAGGGGSAGWEGAS